MHSNDEYSSDDLRNILDEIPENIRVMDEGVDPEIQIEFLQIISEIQKEKPVPVDIVKSATLLRNENEDLEVRKRLLVRLATFPGIEWYKTLETYLSESSTEIRPYALYALQLSRMLLLSDLSDNDETYVTTGLGGKSNKFRIYCVIIPEGDKPFSDKQAKIITREFNFYAAQKDIEVENFRFLYEYASFAILLPFDIPLNDFMHPAIEECNHYGNFICDGFFATNVKIPTHKEILDVIQEKIKPNNNLLQT
ncbi:MAG: hypothetical protein Q7J34_04765 [Bacteroidales bacterium]|nr:hypothetical protein [Bacteroidales bacterium]